MTRRRWHVLAQLLVTLTLTSPHVLGQSPSSGSIDLLHNLTILGFTLDKDTLADVQARLGDAPVRQCSHATEASRELCYSGEDGTRIVFESGFSGGWSKLDAYKVIGPAAPSSSCYSNCPRATGLHGAVLASDGGLRLGMSRKSLLALLGPVKERKGSKLTFRWRSRREMTHDELKKASRAPNTKVTYAYFDVMDVIEVTVRDSKVVEFEVQHTVTQ